ncbi:MAG: YggS family pyridoxal phosphate-dependent enzyme [Alphaproteobacteria bacterium]|nr:YggS family pyridoxal phosphate-dependent enzyme [Alphaproteobacteria bacterium]
MTFSSPEPVPSSSAVAARLETVRRRIVAACRASGRAAGAVTLIAVSKTQPPEAIEAALAAGQRIFGENRVQEAQGRWAGRRDHLPDLELRLIGPLQSNKAADAVALFDVIETLDRPKLADALAAAGARAGKPVRVLVQVNTGAEPQKAGVPPAGVAALIDHARSAGLMVEGLMCIPPAEEAPGPHFALLRKLARRHGLETLSMGMSGDFETAVRFGATHVRVGSSLFGERKGPETPSSD